MHYTSPWFVPGNGVDSPNIYNAVTTAGFVRASTFSLLATDANKVSYFTPRLAGFQLGLSYTPDVTSTNVRANGLGLVAKNLATASEVFEAAVNYSGSFGGVDLGLDGFYTTGSVVTASTDPTEYGVGGNLGYAGFTLGGAWYKADDMLGAVIGANTDTEVWTAGLSYATGPWTVGVAYLDGEGTLAGGSTNENSTWQVGGGYSLGSGVDLGLDLQATTSKVGATGVEYDSNSAGLVLAVSF
jgi:hypothetical protein